ncbi:hypothetical protein PS838_03983 [Pseudomonas fluorescens]|nr:hypothetical protein PS838_03983 [Pseudomonas fluorescens]
MEPELSDICDKYDRLYDFHTYLQQQGYIEKMDCRDFQLGQFGEFEIEEIFKVD